MKCEKTADGIDFESIFKQEDCFPILYRIKNDRVEYRVCGGYSFVMSPNCISVLFDKEVIPLSELYVHRAHAWNALARMFAEKQRVARERFLQATVNKALWDIRGCTAGPGPGLEAMSQALNDNPHVGCMVDSWINGNRSDIANLLWQYPPHIAAQVVLQLSLSHGAEEANSLVNRLIDRFLEERDALDS